MKKINLTGLYKFRPRYSETDQMGVVYYGNYATYFEVGRVELLRSVGMTYAEMERKGTMLPVVHMNIDFKIGAKYDEEIVLETSITEMPSRKISFYHTLKNNEGKLLVKGEVVLVFVDTKSFKPKQCPEELKTLLFKASLESS
jgi:acyl-CoA thioester hydrolase